jgi:molybdate transport system substrate-binding protein
MPGVRHRLALCVMLIAGGASGGRAAPASVAETGATADVLVFAAASLKTALDALAPLLERAAGGGRVRISFAATSALAKQIEAGAPASVFISADEEWMDYVAARKLIDRSSRVNLLGNRLALVAPREAHVSLSVSPGFPIRQALGSSGRLAIADPSAVPAGKYARAALTSLRVWDTVRDRLAPAENVRAALLLVARGEAPLGIVYESDARAEPAVKTVALLPASSHPRIVYPAAVTLNAPAAARRVLEALQSREAGTVFAAQGFQVLSGS